MSTEKFIITKEDTNYSIIPNVICQNLKDAEALGLYIYLVSLPPQWEFYKNVIKNHFGWGRDKLDKKISILKDYGLVEIVATRNEKGQFVDWNLHVKNGREFTITQNTENPYTGDLSTGLDKNSTQNTEITAAVKPVTGFGTPINNIKRHTKSFKKKSFCSNEQKKSKSDWREENEKKHDFAEGMNNAAQSAKQMEREAKHIEESENFKYVGMPESLRSLVKGMKVN